MPIEKWSEQVIIVHLSGDTNLADEMQAAADHVREQPADVVLDFAAVRYLNSIHIARLLKLRKSIQVSGNRLILCGANTHVWGVFLVTGLDKIFDFAESVPTALAALQIAQQA